MNKKTTVLFSIATLFATSIYALSGKVSLTSHSYKEIVVKDKSGHQQHKLIDTKKVLPGDIVVYHNVIDNGTNKSIKHMVINNPIPKEMAYISQSAKCKTPCKILFSADNGKHFNTPENLTILTNGVSHIAKPSEYTNVRWILNKPLAKHQKTLVNYKAKLR